MSSAADFYAPGSYNDPSAPWNEPMIPEKEFDVSISQTLSKDTSIYTQDYQPEFDEETGHTYANTDETDWKKAYCDTAMTPLEIIGAAEKIAKALLEQGQTRVGGVYLKSFVRDCEGWNEDELEVMEE
jgi:hypothetical protein